MLDTWPEPRSSLPPDGRAVVELARITIRDAIEARQQLEREKALLADAIREAIQVLNAAASPETGRTAVPESR